MVVPFLPLTFPVKGFKIFCFLFYFHEKPLKENVRSRPVLVKARELRICHHCYDSAHIAGFSVSFFFRKRNLGTLGKQMSPPGTSVKATVPVLKRQSEALPGLLCTKGEAAQCLQERHSAGCVRCSTND